MSLKKKVSEVTQGLFGQLSVEKNLSKVVEIETLVVARGKRKQEKDKRKQKISK